MNGGLSKMDHEAMRAAYLRALNYKPTLFTEMCNICKIDHNERTGETVDLVTSDTVYKIWYCSDCLTREAEYAEV